MPAPTARPRRELDKTKASSNPTLTIPASEQPLKRAQSRTAKPASVRAVSELDRHVGSMIRLRRLLLGIDQRELARRLDISFQHLQAYEWGLLRAPGSLLYALSEALSVPVNFFFEGLEGVVREKGVRPPKPLSPELQSVIDEHLSPNDDGRSQTEVMRLIAAYWSLAADKRSEALAIVKHAARRGALPDNE
jgi:transcriptional regulator with XRE-family HTH domain